MKFFKPLMVLTLLVLLLSVVGTAAAADNEEVVVVAPFIRVTTMGFCRDDGFNYLRVRNDGPVSVANAAAQKVTGGVVNYPVGPLAPGEFVYIAVPNGSYDGGYMNGDVFVKTHGRSTVPNQSAFCPPPPMSVVPAPSVEPYCSAHVTHEANGTRVAFQVDRYPLPVGHTTPLALYNHNGFEFVPEVILVEGRGRHYMDWATLAQYDAYGCFGPNGTAKPAINAAKDELVYFYNNPTLNGGRTRFCEIWNTTTTYWPELRNDAALVQMAGVCQR